jgi:hypothetical protein
MREKQVIVPSLLTKQKPLFSVDVGTSDRTPDKKKVWFQCISEPINVEIDARYL